MDRVSARAVAAWKSLGRTRMPTHVDVIHDGRHSSVVRMRAAGARGSSVIAKVVPGSRLALEQTLHERILPGLEVPTPRFLGFHPGGRTAPAVLFLEDLGDRPYVTRDLRHRRAAGRWLGTLHGAASGRDLTTHVPARVPDDYRGLLTVIRADVAACSDNPALPRDGHDTIRALLDTLDRVETAWEWLVEPCAPSRRRSFTARSSSETCESWSPEAKDLVTIPFDWEHVSYASPALDLARSPDFASGFGANAHLGTYRAALAQAGLRVEPETVRGLAACGTVFRALAATSWATRSLSTPHVRKPLQMIELYGRCALRALDRP